MCNWASFHIRATPGQGGVAEGQKGVGHPRGKPDRTLECGVRDGCQNLACPGGCLTRLSAWFWIVLSHHSHTHSLFSSMVSVCTTEGARECHPRISLLHCGELAVLSPPSLSVHLHLQICIAMTPKQLPAPNRCDAPRPLPGAASCAQRAGLCSSTHSRRPLRPTSLPIPFLQARRTTHALASSPPVCMVSDSPTGGGVSGVCSLCSAANRLM